MKFGDLLPGDAILYTGGDEILLIFIAGVEMPGLTAQDRQVIFVRKDGRSGRQDTTFHQVWRVYGDESLRQNMNSLGWSTVTFLPCGKKRAR